jgi:biopolymer transport protein ExbD
MNIKRRKRHAAEVATGSLNDIMFFLLLFFLIISTLVNPNVIKLTLPNSKKAATMDKQQVTVAVSKDLQYYVNNKPVSFGELEAAISAATSKLSGATVVLRFDNGLSVQDLVDVLQIGDRLKLKMILATKPSNG